LPGREISNPARWQAEPGNRKDFIVSQLAKQAHACNNNLFVSYLLHTRLTEANFQRSDLLLSSLYDASQRAERVSMKLDCVATALRRQFISYDSAVEWPFRLGLLGYVDREQFRQTKHPRTCTNQLIAVIGKISK
jgi:hypothetical protein